MAKNNSIAVYIVAGLLLFGGLAYLVVSGISQGSSTTLQVSQALSLNADELHNVRLYGKVFDQRIRPHDDAMGVDFAVIDQEAADAVMDVSYRGTVPDTFKAGAEVILKGSWDQAAGVFKAVHMTTKCPSKYEEKREQG